MNVTTCKEFDVGIDTETIWALWENITFNSCNLWYNKIQVSSSSEYKSLTVYDFW